MPEMYLSGTLCYALGLSLIGCDGPHGLGGCKAPARHQDHVRPSEVERFLEVRERALAPSEPATRQEGATTARIIAVTMPKGGTSKTTTTLNLGAALAEAGQRVLLVDFDPRASLTIALGPQSARGGRKSPQIPLHYATRAAIANDGIKQAD